MRLNTRGGIVMKMVNFRIPESLLWRFDKVLKRAEMTRTDMLRSVVLDYVRKGELRQVKLARMVEDTNLITRSGGITEVHTKEYLGYIDSAGSWNPDSGADVQLTEIEARELCKEATLVGLANQGANWEPNEKLLRFTGLYSRTVWCPMCGQCFVAPESDGAVDWDECAVADYLRDIGHGCYAGKPNGEENSNG